MDALYRLARTGRGQWGSSKSPKSFDMVLDVESSSSEPIIEIGDLTLTAHQARAYLPCPTISLPFLHICTTPGHEDEVVWYGTIIPEPHRTQLANHPSPFLPGKKLWDDLMDNALHP